jgi:hypothetical protein
MTFEELQRQALAAWAERMKAREGDAESEDAKGKDGERLRREGME